MVAPCQEQCVEDEARPRRGWADLALLPHCM